MSLVSSFMGLQLNSLRASDSEFGMLKSSERMFNRVSTAGANPSFGRANLGLLHARENNDIANMQQLSLLRKISMAMAESNEKMANDAAKRFNILA